MTLIRRLLSEAETILRAAGLPSPALDAELLLSHFANIPRLQLRLVSDPIDSSWVTDFNDAVRRRAEIHEPIQYITGVAAFHDIELHVEPGVLIPRPETEQLVEHALEFLKDRPMPRVLDLCTGSGAIALAVANARKDATVTATDIANDALHIARGNATHLGLSVTFIQSNLFDALKTDEKFDLIVSNPPYISQSDYDGLDREVRIHEPAIALTDNQDGLTFIRRIIDFAPLYMKPDGALMLEIGENQGDRILKMLSDKAFRKNQILPDLAGKPRFALGFRR